VAGLAGSAHPHDHVATLMAAVPPPWAWGPARRSAPPWPSPSSGAVVSTALSLIVVPTFFVTADRLVTRLRRGWSLRRALARGRPPEA